MRVAIASGKGGTGKTTVATNLAYVAALAGVGVAYADCDVEEPNGHLFLKTVIAADYPVTKAVPQVDTQRCRACGQCAQFCQFNAIVCVGSQTLVYPELCHACGGCRLVCPQEAITETLREIGRVQQGRAGQMVFCQGVLRVGEAQSPPVIRAVKAALPTADLALLDAPAGTACPVVETVRGSDFLLLVTEPTPFGLHDLRLAVELAGTLRLSCGVVINRAVAGWTEVRQFCQQARIPVLAEIPDDLAVAEAYSEGSLAAEAVPGYRRRFANLLREVVRAANGGSLPESWRAKLEIESRIPHPAPTPAPAADAPRNPPVCFLSFRPKSPMPRPNGAGDSRSK